MTRSSYTILGVTALAAGISAFDAERARAEAIPLLDARRVRADVASGIAA
jgi:hypothetical protein